MSHLYSHRPQPHPQDSCGWKYTRGADAKAQRTVPAQACESRPIRADWPFGGSLKVTGSKTGHSDRGWIEVLQQCTEKKNVNIIACKHFPVDYHNKSINMTVSMIWDHQYSVVWYYPGLRCQCCMLFHYMPVDTWYVLGAQPYPALNPFIQTSHCS